MKNGRNTDGTFSKGNTGRPKGSRNKKTLAVESLLEGQAEALTQTAISKALEGDTVALRLCMDRVMPQRKDNYINLDLPKISEPRDLVEAAGCVINSVQTGNLTPSDGSKVMSLLESCQKVLETVELAERLDALEHRVAMK
tara:strand:- start:2726 stop:3148 length:423 start_codon:yes stop_codon:yes gene_type:complete